MKKILATAAAILVCLTAMAGTDNDKKLTAVFSYATFYQPGTGSYVETYLSFDAWNLNFAKSGTQYQATVEMLLTVSRNDSIEVVKKYNLNSPSIASPDADRFNFIDVQRFALSNGIHDLTIQIKDQNSDNAPTTVKQQIAVYYDEKRPSLSSVILVSKAQPTKTPNILSRSGYDMEPYINDFFPEQVGQVNFYYELYNIHNETRDKYVYTTSYIEIQETGKQIESTHSITRVDNDTLIPVFGSIDISMLPSGNYNLVVDIRNNHDDILLYRKTPFFRSNPQAEAQADALPLSLSFASQMNDETELNDYIEALAPIANEAERSEIYSIIKRPGIEEKQRFLYHFWVRREPLAPESAWREYKTRVDYVNANFAFPRMKGIQTDRGRVYLKYGPPDFVRDEKNFVSTKYMGGGVSLVQSQNPNERAVGLYETEVATHGQIFYLPYQLWRYNNLPGDDVNRCFIFWDEFRSGLYKLLHSNAKGEVREAFWERRLSQQQLSEELVGEVGEQFERGY